MQFGMELISESSIYASKYYGHQKTKVRKCGETLLLVLLQVFHEKYASKRIRNSRYYLQYSIRRSKEQTAKYAFRSKVPVFLVQIITIIRPWSFTGVATIYNEEGFKALYKGFAPRVLRLGPGTSLLEYSNSKII